MTRATFRNKPLARIQASRLRGAKNGSPEALVMRAQSGGWVVALGDHCMGSRQEVDAVIERLQRADTQHEPG